MKVLITISDAFRLHIEGFRIHYKIGNTSEAIRELMLAGFKFYGNPLHESARMIRSPSLEYLKAKVKPVLPTETPLVEQKLKPNPDDFPVEPFDPVETAAAWARAIEALDNPQLPVVKKLQPED